jgi:hypothetical protein
LPAKRSQAIKFRNIKSNGSGSEMVQRYFLGLIILFSLAGCEKKTGEAVVLSKEHLAAASPTIETSTPDRPPSVDEQPISHDEITVDGYVMKPEVRGTSRDPRALKEEQWLVRVRMLDDARTFNILTEQTLFDELKEGDRVQVSYRVGKYTTTVWSARIEKRSK